MGSKKYRNPVFEDYKQSQQESFWRNCTAPLLDELKKPRSIQWIIHWSRTNLPGSDYVNALAWLSIHNLITPCYDENNKAHWVTIQNIPYGWSLHGAGKPAALMGRRIKRADMMAAAEAEPKEAEEPPAPTLAVGNGEP